MLKKIKKIFLGESQRKGYEKISRNAFTTSTLSKVKNDGWMNLLTGLGQHGRDKTTATLFSSCRCFTHKEISDLYRSDGITKRIIDLIPSEMLRQGFEIDGDNEGKILAEFEQLDVVYKINRLIQLSRLYGGAICVMGIADGRSLDEPVNEGNIKSINWLHCFDRWQTIVNYDYICCDMNSKNYGLPEYYEVRDYRTGATFIVHYSRVLRMDWVELTPREAMQNQGWGDSALNSIYDELKNYGAAFANVSAIMQDFVNGVLKIPNLSMQMASGCGDTEAMLHKRIDIANLTKSVTNMMVLDGDESYEKLSTNVSGMGEIIDRFMLTLSSVTGIPITLLFGRAPAGLNATGDADIRNFYDMIKQLQEYKLKPVLEKLVRYMMKAEYGSFYGEEPENWSIQFAPLWQNTEEQEANLRRTVAETDAIYIDRGILDPEEVAISRFGGDRWSMNTVIDIKAREGGFSDYEMKELEKKVEQELTPEPPKNQFSGPSQSSSPIVIVDR